MNRLNGIKAILVAAGAALIYTAGMIEGAETCLRNEKKRKKAEASDGVR